MVISVKNGESLDGKKRKMFTLFFWLTWHVHRKFGFSFVVAYLFICT